MCGRYLLTSSLDAIQQMFKFGGRPNLRPNYNVAPTHEMPIVRTDAATGFNELVLARWGLIPHWAKDPKIRYSPINARSETVASKPAFRDAFRKRRALVVADGFFEWRRRGEDKQPYVVRLKRGGPLAFAGLWSHWRSPENEDVISFTIMTTEPNDLVAQIHDRMPVILGEEQFQHWLDVGADTGEILRPCPSDWLEAHRVDKRVGDVRNNDADLLAPI